MLDSQHEGSYVPSIIRQTTVDQQWIIRCKSTQQLCTSINLSTSDSRGRQRLLRLVCLCTCFTHSTATAATSDCDILAPINIQTRLCNEHEKYTDLTVLELTVHRHVSMKTVQQSPLTRCRPHRQSVLHLLDQRRPCISLLDLHILSVNITVFHDDSFFGCRCCY